MSEISGAIMSDFNLKNRHDDLLATHVEAQLRTMNILSLVAYPFLAVFGMVFGLIGWIHIGPMMGLINILIVAGFAALLFFTMGAARVDYLSRLPPPRKGK